MSSIVHKLLKQGQKGVGEGGKQSHKASVARDRPGGGGSMFEIVRTGTSFSICDFN